MPVPSSSEVEADVYPVAARLYPFICFRSTDVQETSLKGIAQIETVLDFQSCAQMPTHVDTTGSAATQKMSPIIVIIRCAIIFARINILELNTQFIPIFVEY